MTSAREAAATPGSINNLNSVNPSAVAGAYGASATPGMEVSSSGASTPARRLPGTHRNPTVRSTVGGTYSEITGGKFANGAASAAFSSAVVQSNYEITDWQRELVKTRRIREFWESRLAVGDPIAWIGLASLNPKRGPLRDFIIGSFINNRANGFRRW